jgi:hypothetical protein
MEYVDVVENKTACEMQTKIELIQYKAFTITITDTRKRTFELIICSKSING